MLFGIVCLHNDKVVVAVQPFRDAFFSLKNKMPCTVINCWI